LGQISGTTPERLSDSSTATVLIVDDNEQNLELVQAYLEDLGCQIKTAKDGFDTLKQSDRSAGPDPADVMMPRMSGFQACSRIKSNPLTRDIPVIMITALNEVAMSSAPFESGADDFLTKPVNKLELLTRVKSLLRVASSSGNWTRRWRSAAGWGGLSWSDGSASEESPANLSDARRLCLERCVHGVMANRSTP